jgi:hypothetical protein
VIAAFCNEVVTAEGTASRVHKPLGRGSALPFEELLIRRDSTLVGAPGLQPSRDHFLMAPLDLSSQDGLPVPAFLRGRLLAHIVERSIEPFEQRRVDRVVLAAVVDGVDEAHHRATPFSVMSCAMAWPAMSMAAGAIAARVISAAR